MKRGGGTRGNPLLLKRAGRLLLTAGLLFLAEKVAVGADLSHPPRFLVRYHPASFSRSHPPAPFSEKAYFPLTQIHVLEGNDSEPKEFLRALRSDPSVAHAEIDEDIQAHLTPDDEFFSLQWPLNGTSGNIAAEEAWDLVNSAENIVVALVDAGCDFDHPDLKDNIWTNSKEIPANGIDDDGNGYVDDVNGYDFIEGDNDPTDENGHGTMVFGIMGAAGNNQSGIAGLAWKLQVMCLRVLDDRLNGTVSLGAEAIEYAAANGANIVNLSWGYVPPGAPSAVLEEAIQKAQAAGILVVASAGNNSSENLPDVPGEANYPSSYSEDNIIAVASTNPQDELSLFSNYGSESVDLGAPGEEVYTSFPGHRFAYFTGTSASAPHLAGAAALVWTKNPTLDYKGIKQLLLDNVDPLPSLAGKTVSGGRLNVFKALTASPDTVSQGSDGSDTVTHQEFDGGGSGGCAFIPNVPASVIPTALSFLLMPALAWTLRRRKNKG